MNDAMHGTLHYTAEFHRLATKIGASSGNAKSELRQRLQPELTYKIITSTGLWFHLTIGDAMGSPPRTLLKSLIDFPGVQACASQGFTFVS